MIQFYKYTNLQIIRIKSLYFICMTPLIDPLNIDQNKGKNEYITEIS